MKKMNNCIKGAFIFISISIIYIKEARELSHRFLNACNRYQRYSGPNTVHALKSALS